ncbi:MAG: CaiB/BaiF CoA-transferase family protein, partial [Rhodocyclaceae bacterium]|nr:CaiB/BaiF CoA-transferase family protein [Rhodocyclaceae bacterium]
MGPLQGIRIIEMAGIGPAPFAAMLFADMGAEVIRIDRKAAPGGDAFDTLKSYGFLNRGRRSLALDLKNPAAVAALKRLVATSDALIEGFRPGVMERLGLGPELVLGRNPKLVYGRMTGWGQEGPLAEVAGHDITYIAIAGALGAIGSREKPMPPLNLVGDFGGGALYLCMGVLAAVIEARRSGRGQVVDTAMSDCVASLTSPFHGMMAAGAWKPERDANMLDGGAHFYGTYECADGGHIAIGAIEPQFYALLRKLAGLDDVAFDAQRDPKAWPGLKAKLAAVIKTRTRAEWDALMGATDAVVAPVLSLAEAPSHPHNVARGTFVQVNGVTAPGPAPRFFGTPSAVRA